MDHEALIQELPKIEQMSPAERISLARRRQEQLNSHLDRESRLGPPASRRARLRFSSEVALLEATGRGDASEVERFLKEGANPDSHNEDGLTPLHQCAIDNNEQIVKLLLRYRADVNAKDTELWTPLHAAACCGYIDIVRLLIDANADLLAVNNDGNMPYDICDDEQTLDLIESQMAERGITQQCIDERRGLPEKQMLDDMKHLHQQGMPLDVRMSDNSTYLHIAAASGYYDVAAFLLRCGVSASVRDNDFWMPVHAAAMWGQSDLIELLCEYGADINAKTNNGETPLDLAEDVGTKSVIQQMQQQEARKKRLAFGVRDSRRASRKRKKFESPQPALTAPSAENPFSARGAIRRQSLRDKSGYNIAKIEAQQEHSDLVRSWSKEDVSNSRLEDVSLFQQGGSRANDGAHGTRNRESPKKRLKPGEKSKPMSPDEWLRKLQAESNPDDDDEGAGALTRSGRGRSGSKKKKNGKGKNAYNEQELTEIRANSGRDNHGMNGMSAFPSKTPPPYPTSSRAKKGCCCIL